MAATEEFQRYLDSIEDKNGLPYAATEFLSNMVVDPVLAQAAAGLKDGLASIQPASTSAQLLMVGYSQADPALQAMGQAWNVTGESGRFRILTAAQPLALAGAPRGLSVLVMLGGAVAEAPGHVVDELIRSLTETLDRIRLEAISRGEEAQRRAAMEANDADGTGRRNLLAAVAGPAFTPDQKAQTLAFLQQTLSGSRDEQARPLDASQQALRQRYDDLGDNDLALIHAMGAPLVALPDPAGADDQTRNRMMDFEDLVLAVMRDGFGDSGSPGSTSG